MADQKHGAYYYPQAVLFLKLILEDFGDKSAGLADKDFDIQCLARNVTVFRNEYSKADTFKAELDYKSFPFDPRCIRSCGIVICMQDMGSVFTNSNALNAITPTPENTMFTGFADDESITFNDDSRTVKLEGRDNTALLIDKKFLRGNIALDKSVDQVISELLSELRETREMKVEVRGISEPLPILANFFSDKSELSGKKNTKKDQSYWDLIQSIVADAGLIAFVELDKLVITKPRVLFSKNQAKRFIYGHNIQNLEFSRKIGRKKGFNIAVKCFSIEAKEVIEALIPKEATDAWSRETGIPNIEVINPKVVPVTPSSVGSNSNQQNQLSDQEAEAQGEPAPYMTFRVANVANKEQLIEIGQAIYEEAGRQQIEGSFETVDMKIKYARPDGGSELFNILKLMVGTPISVEIDSRDMKNILDVRNKTGIERYLVSKKYDSRVARYLSESLARSSTPLYTRAIEFSLDADQGFYCKIEFLNFIEVPQQGAS